MQSRLPSKLATKLHVGIIMDGNGRWATEHGVSVADGHRAGSRALRPVVETAIDLGIESLVVRIDLASVAAKS